MRALFAGFARWFAVGVAWGALAFAEVPPLTTLAGAAQIVGGTARASRP